YLVRRKRDGEAARLQPGDLELAALFCGLSARALHLGPVEDGAVREPGLAEVPGVRGDGGDRRLECLAARPDHARLPSLTRVANHVQANPGAAGALAVRRDDPRPRPEARAPLRRLA